MEPLIVLLATFVVLWVLFIRPQQRRVRAHQALVASIEPGDEVVLTAGIIGRIVDLGPEELVLEVAPGVQLRVARQAVLRRVEDARGTAGGASGSPGDTTGTTTRLDATGDTPGNTPGATTDDEPDR